MLNRKPAGHMRNSAGSDVDGARLPTGSAKLLLGKRQVLFQEREPALFIYEVLEGTLMIYHLLADGRRQIVDLALPGSVSGYSRDGSHEYSCEAMTPSSLIAYDRAVLKSADAISIRLLQQMERQVCELASHIVLLGRKTTEERLASFLVKCAKAWRTGGDEKAASFHIPMTRVEIGDYLGLSLETVSRGIAGLERRGIVSTGSRQGEMRVNDVAALSDAPRTKSARHARSL